MIIICPNCKKNFNVKDYLIPDKGRFLKCSFCTEKWFFKKTIKKKTISRNYKNDEKSEITPKKTEVKEVNIFKIFIVFIISIITLILILDTFKYQISLFYPNIENVLNSLYQSLIDIYLFFKDLIN